MRYAPIEDHGVIGDMHTVALVATDGTIDWFCPPRFDAPSVFGSILDADKGGRFQIAPVNGGGNVKQLYLPDTNVLITRFLTAHGVGEVQDFMPIHEDVEQPQRIVRRVMSVRGAMTFKLDCSPAFDYARTEHRLNVGPTGAVFATPTLTLSLSSPVALTADRRQRRGRRSSCSRARCARSCSRSRPTARRSRAPCPTRSRSCCSTRRSRSGGTGWRAAPTAAAGARRCGARRWC